MKARVTGWGAGGGCQSPPSDLSEAQTGSRSILRLEVPRIQTLALGANDLVSVVGQCYLQPQCHQRAVSQKPGSTLVLPRSQLPAARCHHALSLSFLPILSLPLPAPFLLLPVDWLVNYVNPRPIVSLFTTHWRVCLHTSFR